MQPRTELQRPTDATILSRALEVKGAEIPLEGAKFILDLSIREEDQARMLELLAKRQDAKITAEEAAELESYIEADDVLSVFRVKALIAMKRVGAGT